MRLNDAYNCFGGTKLATAASCSSSGRRVLDGRLAPFGTAIAEPDLYFAVAQARTLTDLLSQIGIGIVGLLEHGLKQTDLLRCEARPQTPILRDG